MNSINLYKPTADGGFAPTRVYACGKCGSVKYSDVEAEACCRPRLCQCGKPVDLGWTVCNDCRQTKDIERERNRFNLAEKVTEWDGPVYLEGAGYSDGFFADVGEFLDWWDDDYPNWEGEPPGYVWTCDVSNTVQCRASEMIENIEWPEGMEDNELKGLPELRAAVDAFNAANAEFKSWEPNYKRALILSLPKTETPDE